MRELMLDYRAALYTISLVQTSNVLLPEILHVGQNLQVAVVIYIV